jgi:hypothetical protein
MGFCGELDVQRITCSKLPILLQLILCASLYEGFDWLHMVEQLLFCGE